MGHYSSMGWRFSSEFIAELRRLFSGKEEDSIILSTIHRAKGLEADQVFIVEPQLLPHPKAESDAARESERCLEFVAYARARKALYFVDVPSGHSRLSYLA